MLGCVAAYKGLYNNTGDCSQKALQKYSRPWIIFLIYISSEHVYVTKLLLNGSTDFDVSSGRFLNGLD